MMVTFISQCEKKALNRTRRIMDTFANRIGSRTWQTVITNEGLNAVKKLLRKTASKNTAVSCHWLRSRSRCELVWIVGNRLKFNSQGIVPVNSTQKTIMNTQWENDWHYLPLIKALSALAALFHDWGKASSCFQKKLQPGKSKKIISDPLRHEWVSVLLLNAFVNEEPDEKWLDLLATGNINNHSLKERAFKNIQKPLAKLPPLASLLAWLVLSHHKLPLPNKKEDYSKYKNDSLEDFNELFAVIKSNFGYENTSDEESYKKRLEHCLLFPDGLVSESKEWLKEIKKRAIKMQGCLDLFKKTIDDGSWRLILYHARLSVMLGDHFYSSQDADYTWQSDLPLYANTDRESGKLKQKLDEHIVGVAKHALQTAHLLPAFEVELPKAEDIKLLKKLSPTGYRWQDKAVAEIKNWKQTLPEGQKDNLQSFFLVNMASTGCGKTFANAKIMQVLSPDSESLRYILALGLRTLTLQTGDEYRERIGLDNSELAVLIGSKVVMELHKQNKENKMEETMENDAKAGSESLETLLDEDVDYQCAIPENRLTTVIPDERSRKFLYAPVLACTIDHLMAATETRRGGRYILPSLRLMSSDLVIDEIDDFVGKDLIAIGRLIHLAGMLGRKVMISSATIPPNLAEGYFNAYREGWQIFAETREVCSSIHCAWIDEFNTNVATISENQTVQAIENYRKTYSGFVEKRIQKLKNQNIRRKGEIIKCAVIKTENHTGEENKQNIEDAYYSAIQQSIIQKHLQHSLLDEYSKKQVSFGVVRMANINPCIALTEYLSNVVWPENIDIRVMAYHSQQVLLMRNEQEKHLDCVLKRKQADSPFTNSIIKNHLKTIKAEQVIFILVATPVEEVGRDHDFDWAVIEPSSYRSIIQLAGRVLRHRDYTPTQPNIAIMQYNLKALKTSEDKAAYTRPGYERDEKAYRLSTHDMSQLIDENIINRCINSIPRIQRNKQLKQNENFADLEHFSIEKLLTTYNDKGPEAMQGWLTQCWWLTALPQTLNPFREKSMQLKLFLVPDKERFSFMEKDKVGRLESVDTSYGVEQKEMTESAKSKLWLNRNYEALLDEQAELTGMSAKHVALKYGEISLPVYGDVLAKYQYSSQLGLRRLHN